MSEHSQELVHERALAEHVGLVRLVLTVANFAVIALDPVDSPLQGYAWVAASLFFAYALWSFVLVKTGRVTLARYELVSPVLDVLFATILILSTQGHQSPFTLWIVFAVVATSFSRYKLLPLAATGLGLLAHGVIAATPQQTPLDPGLFMVRTGYLLGFAAIVAMLSSHLNRQSQVIAALERIERELAESNEESEAASALERGVATLLPGSSPVVLLDPAEEQGMPLRLGDRNMGVLRIQRPRPLRPGEERVVATMAERFLAAVGRMRLAADLVRAAAHEERLRLADELHDTFLQTLAAIDLRAEAGRQNLAADPEATAEELAQIKAIARRGAVAAREFIHRQQSPPTRGHDVLETLIRTRWEGKYELELEEGLSLSEAQWNTIELLAKEGMNNARKHGSASRIRFVLEETPSEVLASLENDGAPPPNEVAFGYGLSRLRSAVRNEGGELALTVSEGGNTVLLARFPRRNEL
ncbi:MAG TPA: histidine kinase [Fimbriimonadaceae bacterium]|nr:histidine kinase [Fimbriimonadaceae bacterium]